MQIILYCHHGLLLHFTPLSGSPIKIKHTQHSTTHFIGGNRTLVAKYNILILFRRIPELMLSLNLTGPERVARPDATERP